MKNLNVLHLSPASGNMQDVVYVKKSLLKGAGGGLFASRDLKKGVCVGSYEGLRVSAEAIMHPDYQRGYLMNVGGGTILDARDPKGRLLLSSGRVVNVHTFTDQNWGRLRDVGVGWVGRANLMRFVNMANTRESMNLTLSKHCCGGGVGYVAKRDIKAGEELFVNYGGTFFKNDNDDVCDACMKPGLLVECDSCRRSFHLRCCKPAISSVKCLPSGEWICHKCRARNKRRG